jgi:cytochrome oxidase Cu insertion factor (SCO1/SenC/PrrC family)
MRRPVLLGALFLLCVGAAIAGGWAWRLYREQPAAGTLTGLQGLQVLGEVPDFSLTERGGRTVTRADLAARVWVANFIYTSCTDTCPLQTAQMARLHKEFEAEARLLFVSITVDPRRDTPHALNAYAAKYGADPTRWWFLTGKKQPIYALIQDGFHLSVEDPSDSGQPRVRPAGTSRSGTPGPQFDARGSRLDLLGSRLAILGAPAVAWAHSDEEFLAPAFLHSSWFVLGDRQARIRGYYKSDLEEDLGRLRRDIRTLLADPAS